MRKLAFLNKLKGLKKWEGFLPLFFIGYLLFTLAWQYSNLNKLTGWIDRTDKILEDLKELDNHLLEMHGALRGYQLTERRIHIDEYRSSLQAYLGHYEELQREVEEPEIKRLLKDTQSDTNAYFKFADKIIWEEMRGRDTDGYTKRGEGIAIIRKIRDKISRMTKLEVEVRASKKETLERAVFSFYVLSGLGLLAVAGIFLWNWLRQRKWALALQETQDNYRRMTDAAREAEERLRGLMESAHDLILITDEKGRILFVNEQLAKSFGYGKKELLGQTLEVLVPERYRKLHVIQRSNYMKNPTARPMGGGMELYGRRRDGTEIPVEISLSPFRLRGRLEVAAIIRDISMRKNYELKQRWMMEISALMAQSLDPQQIMRHLGEYCLGKCSDWTVVIPAAGAIKVMQAGRGGGPEDLSGLVHSSLDPFREILMGWLKENGPTLRQNISQDDIRKYPLHEKDIENIFRLGIRSAVIVPMMARDRILGGIIHVSRDRNYTQDDLNFAIELSNRAALSLDNARLYQVSQQLAQAEEELMRIVSHDLKNPLSSLKLNIQMVKRHLEKEASPDPLIMRRTGAIEKIVDQAIKLIKDLLDTARLETGGLELNKQLLDPGQLIRETETLFTSLAEEKKIRMSFSFKCDRKVHVKADHERVMQVISNIVGNALKYTPEGGEIGVSALCVPQGVQFSISDSGPGVVAEKVPHLFEKYWKEESTGKQNLGLGLAIAKGIVDSHGGRIWVDTKLNKGTTFHFLLPQAGKEADIPNAYREDKKNLISLRPPEGENKEDRRLQ